MDESYALVVGHDFCLPLASPRMSCRTGPLRVAGVLLFSDVGSLEIAVGGIGLRLVAASG